MHRCAGLRPRPVRDRLAVAVIPVLPKIGYERSGTVERDFGAQYCARMYSCQRLIRAVTDTNP